MEEICRIHNKASTVGGMGIKHAKCEINPCWCCGRNIEEYKINPCGSRGKNNFQNIRGEVYRIHNKPLSVESTKTHSRSLWAAWVDYTEYTANPYGGMREVCRIPSKPLWVAWGRYLLW